MKHTPTPWSFITIGIQPTFIRSQNILEDGFPEVLANLTDADGEPYTDNSRANAERIVACVNAFDGIEDPQQYIDDMKENLARYREENIAITRERNRLAYDKALLNQEIAKLKADIANTNLNQPPYESSDV